MKIRSQFRWALFAVIASAWAYWAGLGATAQGQQYCPDGSCPQQGGFSQLAPVQPREQATLPAEVRQAIVRVVNQRGNARAFGSGTLVEKDAKKGIVVTCGHLFNDGTGNVTVFFPNGKAYSARVLAVDAALDLSALEIAAPDASPIAMAQDFPRVGEVVTSTGYGQQGRLATNQGQALGFVRVNGNASFSTLEISGMARQGDSGGPMLNARHELCGVLFGTNQRVVDGTCCPHVRGFLDRIRGRLRSQKPLPAVPPGPDVAVQMPGPMDEPLVQAPPRPEVPPPPDDTSLLDRLRADMADKAAALKQRDGVVAGLQSRLDQVLADAAKVAPQVLVPDVGPIGAVAEKAGSAWLTTLLVGIGLPAGPAGVAAGLGASALIGGAGYFLRSRLGRKPKLQPRKGGDHVSGVNTPDPPPPPRDPVDVAVYRNHFVPYENNTLDKARAKADEILVNQFPGYRVPLKAAQRLADQILKGEPLPN